jgi:hypothetical protein
MTARLQSWVNAFDAALRQDAVIGPSIARTPKPEVFVSENSVINAWVNRIGVRWNVGGTIERPPSTSLPAAPTDLFHLKRIGKITAAIDAPMVVTRPHDAAALTGFVAFHDLAFTDCRLSTDGASLRFGSGCLVDYTVTSDASTAVGFVATESRIGITTAMLRALDEPSVVAVLAHELGHYYRGHSSTPIEVFNYFYSLDEVPAGRRPTPDPRFADATRTARGKLRQDRWLTDFPEENALIVKERLGFYTTEQEADELSLELLARVGLSPDLGPESQLGLMRALERAGHKQEPGTVGYADCAARRAADFRDDTGVETPVPVGDVARPHHSGCFRVFNMVREIRGHAYAIANPPIVVPDGASWEALVSDLSR